jgi:hypothetical protein
MVSCLFSLGLVTDFVNSIVHADTGAAVMFCNRNVINRVFGKLDCITQDK